ncbi:MAG: hypothetical protein CMN69_07355 [Sphingomonadaceae bacterium]|nr:hypothetical protein [Sphingomonadaceae bacterium]
MTIPRAFTYRDVDAVIENGVARDILKAGMAELLPSSNPLNEAFILSDRHVAILVNLVGEVALIERGLL